MTAPDPGVLAALTETERHSVLSQVPLAVGRTDDRIIEAVSRIVAARERAAVEAAIDFAHEQRRALDEAGWRDEVMTLAQHWGATAGWLAQRIRYIERGDEPDMPDAMIVREGDQP